MKLVASPCTLCDPLPDLSLCSRCTSGSSTGVRPSALPQYLRRLRLSRPSILRQIACPQPRREPAPSSSEEVYRYERSRGKDLYCQVDNCLPMKKEEIEYEPKKTVAVDEFEMYEPEAEVEVKTPKKKCGLKKVIKTVEEFYEKIDSDEDKELDEVVVVPKKPCPKKPEEKKCGCEKKEKPKPKVIEYVKKSCGCKKTHVVEEEKPIVIGEIEYIPKKCIKDDVEIVHKKPCSKKDLKEKDEIITIVSKCKCGQDKTIEYVPKKHCGCKKPVKVQEEIVECEHMPKPCECKKPVKVQEDIEDCGFTIKIDGIEYETKKKAVCKKVVQDDDTDDVVPIKIAGIEYVPKKTDCTKPPKPSKPSVDCKCFCEIE